MCTNIEITAKNGEHFWGRTMDLALPIVWRRSRT